MTPAHTPAHAPLLTKVPDIHAVASLSVAVVQVTAVALATGVHAADQNVVVCSSRRAIGYVNAKTKTPPVMYTQ
jgi:hypothetical protein